MKTDNLPKKTNEKDEYSRSDALKVMALPPPEPLRSQALELKEALSQEDRKEIQRTCKCIIESLSIAYDVDMPGLKVLSVRPREVTDKWVFQTFGDYDFETALIRLWMRTAVQKKVTSYGTLLSTLCHEYCHHLDVVKFELPNTFHTRGFYERAGLLYHHAQGTPVRQIVWIPQSGGTFAVDWAKTMNSSPLVRA